MKLRIARKIMKQYLNDSRLPSSTRTLRAVLGRLDKGQEGRKQRFYLHIIENSKHPYNVWALTAPMFYWQDKKMRIALSKLHYQK